METERAFARSLRHGIQPKIITDAQDISCLLALNEHYYDACMARPFVNRIILARKLGSKQFNIPVTELLAADSIDDRRAEVRQIIMAFTYVVGQGKHKYMAIGRAFNRKHATVIHAVKKYENGLRELLR